MMEVMYSCPETGLEIEMGLPQEGDLEPELAELIAKATATENMKSVTPEQLMQDSAAAFVARIDKGNGREFAGFLRQLDATYLIPTSSRRIFCAYELGSLWVNPDHRGMAIGRQLVGFATGMMSVAHNLVAAEFGDGSFASSVPHVALAVCNNRGGSVFESVAYDTVGKLPGREVKLASPAAGYQQLHLLPAIVRGPFDTQLDALWRNRDGVEVAAGLSHYERFAGMTLLQAV